VSRVRLAAPTVAGLAALLLASCTAEPSAPVPSAPAATPSVTTTSTAPATAAPSASEIREPTTTNTLPPPPAPTAPAPSTAGQLNATTLPVPKGWKKARLKGSDEEGFRGNGSWVHARDARYAAQDAITLGCAEITRDDYPDPVSALEGNYTGPGAEPGVGLVLDFRQPDAAARYLDRYREQVTACTTTDDPLRARILSAGPGLVDRRIYPDSRWTEVAKQTGTRVTLIILSDPKARITAAAANRILAQIGG
jgi:hypothetical protein